MTAHGPVENTLSIAEKATTGPPGAFVSTEYKYDCARFLDELKQRLRAVAAE
jgi:hypothetical protein